MKSGPTVLKSKWSVHLQGLQERWGNTARTRGLPRVKAGCGGRRTEKWKKEGLEQERQG